VLIFDDLRESPEETYGAICRFLAIDEDFRPPNLGTVVNPYVRFRSLRIRNLARKLPPRLAGAVGRVNTLDSAYPAMDRSLRSELIARFEHDNATLETWLGRDLAGWRT
jgi:hypothetical protein